MARKVIPDNPAFRENELEANRQMGYACLFMAGATLLVLLLYILKVFPLYDYTGVYIGLPILFALLLTPSLWALVKNNFIRKPGYKYFVLLLLLACVGFFNVLVPKHGILGYALVLIIATHYYNPHVGRVVFYIMLPTMLVCLYAGAFLGEYDPNLLGPGRVVIDEVTGVGRVVEPVGPADRYAYLQERLANGSNRFVAILLYYYFGRAIFLSLIFITCNALNYRTWKLLNKEVTSEGEKAKLMTELSVAEEVQRNVLPSAIYQTKDFELLCQLRPAKEVGGDFYDYWFPDKDHIAFVIGDVSGKGVPGAMFMMKTITSIRASYSLGLTPKQVLEKTNKLIFVGNISSMFVTVFFGVMDLNSGILQFANAGHTPPILRVKGKYFPLPCAKGFVLGGMEEVYVTDETVRLPKGGGIFLYTDGITEARNEQGEFFGEKRLLHFLNTSRPLSIVEFSHDLEDSIIEFAGGAEQSDDITYLLLSYRGEVVRFEEREFLPILDEGTKVRDFIQEQARLAKVPAKTISQFLICVDEIFSNIVKYGGLSSDQRIIVRTTYHVEKKQASITMVDFGVPFDPTQVKEKTVDERETDAPVGQLGVMMVMNIMDEVSYHRINGKNVISLTKKLI